MTAFLKKINKYVPTASMVIIALGVITAGINAAYVLSTPFADWFNSNVSSVLRMGLAYLTSWIPFSLAEYCLIASPFIVAAIIAVSVKYASTHENGFVRAVTAILSVIVAVYIVFALNFGAGYRTTTLDKRMELDDHGVRAGELFDTMTTVVERINALEGEVKYQLDNGSIMPYSNKECVEKCVRSYDKLAEKYDFITSFKSPVKEIILSPYMTYTHISGVYTFFTGEANLNTNFPDFVNAYTIAHEMAHQRGIARENEANFIAYLVCINSEDKYLQYSGYMNMYQYLAEALYKASPTLYAKAAVNLSNSGKYELQCYSKFFDKYRDNVAADVSGTVNDKYLTAQGTEGERSYGMVVDLAVAYHKAENKD